MEENFRNNVIEYSLLQLNKPYIWGATGPNEFDCSGLTFYIFKTLFNIDINETGFGEGDTTKQMTSDIGILTKIKKEDINKIKPGDILFFHRQSLNDNEPKINNRYPGHVGIYLGNKKFIHASSDEKKVIISTLDKYWQEILVGTKDIISKII